MSKRSRKWCFTLNNYTDEEVNKINKLGENKTIKWLLYGKEKGENGTPHLQGCIVFINARRFTAVKKSISSRCHLELMKGSFSQNADYCKKEGNFKEFGKQPDDPLNKGEKEKQRWKDVMECVKSGDLEKVAELHPDIYLRNLRQLDYARARYVNGAKGRLKPDDLTCHWLWGEPGTGKTRAVWDNYEDSLYVKGANKWWDQYDGESTVLIDDVDARFVREHWQLFKQWADVYPFTAEIKGGTLKHIRPQRIIVTSNQSMDMIFPDWDAGNSAALKRRFKEYEFKADNAVVYP